MWWTPAKWALGATALLLAGALLMDECTRALECAMRCGERYYANARLLSASVCADRDHRRDLGPQAEALCARAEQENAVPLMGCAARAYWAGSGVYGALSSPLTMLAVVVPVLLYAVNQWFADRRARRRDADAQENMRALRELLAAPHFQPHQSAPFLGAAQLQDTPFLGARHSGLFLAAPPAAPRARLVRSRSERALRSVPDTYSDDDDAHHVPVVDL